MKKSILIRSLVLILFLPLLNSCSQKKEVKGDSVEFNELSEIFMNPGKEYRPTPFWVWNDRMDSASIDMMLNDFSAKGFGGVFVHPRPGLITEYLSDDWFDLFRYSVDKGLELGLNIWIYDENSYPSGFAGGHVPAQMPESYNQGQGLKMTEYETLPDTLSSYYLCLLETDGNIEDITNEIKDFKGKKGKFYVFRKTYYGKSPWYGGFSYVDLLVPGVTQKFQEITMEGYEKVAGDQFGKSVPGIFTDEPEIPTSGGIRWTPDLFEVFEANWGYNLKMVLPSLFKEVGDWKKIRHNYTETLLQMFIDRWAQPWYEYCQNNNLKWTGHYWEHGWPTLAQGGDNMAMYAWHQMPGIDMLFNQFNEISPRAQFGNIRSVKELRSVANQLGYKRTLCETYGGGGWDVTFEDLKRLGDWTYVLGVNFMNQHLSHITLKGARKYDYPPVFTYHSPWWPHYKTLNDYFSRLSVVLSLGEQINDMLILEPTTTLWNYYSYIENTEALEQIGQEFQSMITRLEKAQVEYDLGSENIIRDHGKVKDGKFIVGHRSYSVIVIPELVENLEEHTYNLLIQFAEQGGKIISFSIPERISGETDKRVSEFFKTKNASSVILLDKLENETLRDHFMNPEIQFSFSDGGNLYHQRRKYKDGQLVYLVNSSLEEGARGSFKTNGLSVVEMDAFNGTIKNYPSVISGKKVTVDFQLPAAGSLLLFITNKKINLINKNDKTLNELIVEGSSDMEIVPLRDNVMKVDFCDLSIGGDQYTDLYFAKAADIVFNKYGFEGNPWNHSVQYKNQIVERDTFQTGGFNVSYNFKIEGNVSGNDMKICVERPDIFMVKVNESVVHPLPGEWFLDNSFHLYDISSFVKTGDNKVELKVEPMSVFAEIEPVYICGSFSVLPADTGWVINMKCPEPGLGSWKEQGLPFYSWEVAYRKTYDINEVNLSYKISVPKWYGTVSEVLVNGTSAGTIAFEPYELDISDFIKKGSNDIEILVTGSLKNLLGPHFNNPDPGLASPWHWRNVDIDIPGNEYQMMNYGLFDDFNLISYEIE